MCLILALKRADYEFKARRGYIRVCLKRKGENQHSKTKLIYSLLLMYFSLLSKLY
jgi:hypothetical protein